VIAVRHGMTRTVFVTRHRAIKIPRWNTGGEGFAGLLWTLCRGVLANQSEAEWWRHADVITRPALCPVLRSWLGGIINVYPRCQPFHVTEEQELAMFHRTWLPVGGITPAPGDEKPQNYGWLKVSETERRLVRIDYDMNWNGCSHDRSGAINARERDE
jgi:hypothetical protein